MCKVALLDQFQKLHRVAPWISITFFVLKVVLGYSAHIVYNYIQSLHAIFFHILSKCNTQTLKLINLQENNKEQWKEPPGRLTISWKSVWYCHYWNDYMIAGCSVPQSKTLSCRCLLHTATVLISAGFAKDQRPL